MNKQLHIGIIIDQLVPGGVQKLAIQEAKELKKLGHKTTLYILVKYRYQYQYQYHDLIKDLNIIFLSDLNPWPFRHAIRIPYFAFLTNLHILNPFFVKRYQKALKNTDFLISHGTTTCITASAISKKFNIPYMAFIYDPMTYILEKVYGNKPIRLFFPVIKYLIKQYENSFMTSAALIVTQSKFHEEYIKNMYHIDPKIIHPACITPKYKKTYDKPNKKNTILGYTRWEFAKNPDFFIWLAKKLPQANFLIAGTWPNPDEKAQFQNRINLQKLHDRIKLLPAIRENELGHIAGSCLAWVHPHVEAFGMSGLEMASYGLPIVIPRSSGVSEIFINKKHGIFPHSTDKYEYLKAIRYLLKNPDIAIKMGNAAAEIACNCTWKKHAHSVVQSIQEYLSKVKITCIANGFVSTKSTGGGDHFILELLKRIPDNIYITLILPPVGYYHLQKLKINSPNLRCIILKSSFFDNRDTAIPLFFAYMFRAFSTYNILKQIPAFAALHTATDLISDTIPAYLYHNKRKGIPWISRFFHFVDPPHKREGKLWVNTGSYLLQKFSLILLRNADSIMIDNPNLKKLLIKKGIREFAISLHTGGVDFSRIANMNKNNKLVSDAVFLGRLTPHKGIFDAITAWKVVVKNKPDAKLNIIGYGTEEVTNKIIQTIKKEKLQKNIMLRGYIHDKDNIAAYLRSSKIFLFLDHEAGFGLVVPEAMAAGLPVISYDLPIFGSVYKKGYIDSPVKDIHAVATKTLELLTHKNIYKHFAYDAREQAKIFDWSAASKKFYRDINRIIKTIN